MTADDGDARAAGLELMAEFMMPPVVRHRGPMVDAHLHVRPPRQMATFLRVAEAYGVRTYAGVADLDVIAACREALGDRVVGVLRLSYEDLGDRAHFRSRTGELLERGVSEHGVRGVKFWFKPDFNASHGLYLDDSRLDFIFDFMVARRLVATVHIADPDIWFERHYADRSRFGTKLENYEQLENRMRRHPDLLLQGAHLGGDPEHLDHLEELLGRHANLWLDLSATKWVARELSAQPDRARTFVIRHADRIVWGSDLVVGRRDGMTADDYATRYYVHRHLWEGRGEIVSPIEDADAGRPVIVVGLDLPDDVLEKIYVSNAERLYGIVAAR